METLKRLTLVGVIGMILGFILVVSLILWVLGLIF